MEAALDRIDTLKGRLSITTEDAAFSQVHLKNLKITGTGRPDTARISIETKGALSAGTQAGGTPVPVALSTRMHMAHKEAWRICFDDVTAGYDDLHITLAHPATLVLTHEKAMLDMFELRTAQSRLKVKGEITPDTLEVSAHIHDFPLRRLEPMIDQDLTGMASVNVGLSGPLTAPEVHMDAHIRDYRPPLKDMSKPLVMAAGINAARQGDRFVLDATLSGLSKDPFKATAMIPARLSLKPVCFKIDPDADITGHLMGRFDLAVLQALPALDNMTLSGQVDVDLALGGSFNRWALNGSATITQGRHENIDLGLILDQITGRIDAKGKTLQLTRLNATDHEKGRIALSGEIVTSPSFSVDTRLRFDEATLLRKEVITAKASGDLDINGNMERLNLTGDIRLDRTELTIPKRLPPTVVDIPVKEINAPPGTPSEPIDTHEGLELLFLNIAVDIPARFFVRGHGLDAEFKGRLTARGPAHNPVVRGTLNVVRGTYQFLARTFHIVEGQIAFDGATPPTPFLNVTAQVNAGEIDAQVRITGPTDDFDLTLLSQPPLPQDEIMAHILFGQSAAKLNPFQAYQLAAAISQLSGRSMPDVLGKTRKILGVDRLSFSGGDTGDDTDTDPSVEVGRYVSDKVYVGVEQDLTDAKQDIMVEVYITPNFSVESKAGTKSGAGLGFSWKYDY